MHCLCPVTSLAYFNRAAAIPTYCCVIAMFVLGFVLSADTIISGQLSKGYGWLAPTLCVGTLIYIPALARSFKRCLFDEAMIFVQGNDLIAFDRTLICIPLKNIVQLNSESDGKIVVIKISGVDKIDLRLSRDKAESVIGRYAEYIRKTAQITDTDTPRPST